MEHHPDTATTVSLISSHLRHLASVSILAVGGVLVMLEIGLLEMSPDLLVAGAGFLLTAILGISMDQRLIIEFAESQRLHRRYKLYLYTTMFTLGIASGFFFGAAFF